MKSPRRKKFSLYRRIVLVMSLKLKATYDEKSGWEQILWSVTTKERGWLTLSFSNYLLSFYWAQATELGIRGTQEYRKLLSCIFPWIFSQQSWDGEICYILTYKSLPLKEKTMLKNIVSSLNTNCVAMCPDHKAINSWGLNVSEPNRL